MTDFNQSHQNYQTTKTCSSRDKCIHPDGPVLPATRKYFGQLKSSKDGLQYKCKLCLRQYNRLMQRHNRHNIPQLNNGAKDEWLTLYALIDPFTDKIMYYGITARHASVRLSQHMQEARRKFQDNSPRLKWLRNLQDQGLRPGIMVVDFTKDTGWKARKEMRAREKSLIAEKNVLYNSADRPIIHARISREQKKLLEAVVRDAKCDKAEFIRYAIGRAIQHYGIKWPQDLPQWSGDGYSKTSEEE